jgi:hypothetical protein
MPFVRPYVRSDGTPVRGHSRWAPGARREMTIAAIFCLAVLGLGNAHSATEIPGVMSRGYMGPELLRLLSLRRHHAKIISNGTSTTPPNPSVTYPIRIEHSTNSAPRTAAPRPSVSYPIRFDTPTVQRAVPTPSVSYPIDLFALEGER